MSQKILIIDDDIISQNMLRATLTKAGYSVIAASDGAEGIKKATEEPPDLIILDIMMPGMDGGDVAAALKNDSKMKDIPIIFLSSLIQDYEAVFGSNKKKSLVSKPYSREGLLNEVKKYFQKE